MPILTCSKICCRKSGIAAISEKTIFNKKYWDNEFVSKVVAEN